MDLSAYRGKKIAVLMGGMSSEREVSLRSGVNVMNALTSLGLNAVKIDVDRDIASVLKQTKADIAFNALHGTYGEDGCIQGVLEIMGLPYTGPGVAACAIAMDKLLTKGLLKSAGLPVPESIPIRKEDWESKLGEIRDTIGYPAVLKPNAEGSSVGVELIDDEQSLRKSLANYFDRFKDCFIEQFVAGKELTVGALIGKSKKTVFPILELKPKNKFYDYEAKYTAGLTDFVIPAEIPQELTKRIQSLTLRGCEVLGLKGAVRLDAMLNAKNEPFFLEANALPGLTATSDIPAMAKAYGMSFEELMVEILDCVEMK